MPSSALFGPPLFLACCGSFFYSGGWSSLNDGGTLATPPSTTTTTTSTPIPTTSPLPVSPSAVESEDIIIEIHEDRIRISNYDRLFMRRDDAAGTRASGVKDALDSPATSSPNTPLVIEREGRPSPPDDSKDALNVVPEEEAPPAPRAGRASADVLIKVPSRGVNGFARSRNLVQIQVFEGGLPDGFARGPEGHAQPEPEPEMQEAAEEGPSTGDSPMLEEEEEEEEEEGSATGDSATLEEEEEEEEGSATGDSPTLEEEEEEEEEEEKEEEEEEGSATGDSPTLEEEEEEEKEDEEEEELL